MNFFHQWRLVFCAPRLGTCGLCEVRDTPLTAQDADLRCRVCHQCAFALRNAESALANNSLIAPSDETLETHGL